jgi:hypothetical protein
MGWPGRCVAVVEHEAAVSRYQVRLSDDEVVRWAGLEGCAASLGFSKAGRLVCLVVDAPRVVPVHTALVFDEAGYWAVLNDHRRLSLERDPWGATDSWLESERNLSAARQNAWLSLAADGVVTELYVNDVADGDAIGFDRAAPVVDAVQCWVSWPAEVRASRWPDGDRTCIAVLFGVDDVELWQCLGSSRLWVGTGAGGELRTLVLADADEAPPGWLEAAEYDDWSEDPAEMPHLARWVAIAPTLRFDLYGLVGKLADGVSGRSGRGGVPSGLELTFEDDDDERCMTVNSSREGLATTRLNMSLSMQDDSHTATMFDDWQPAMISVDGAPVEFMARHAEDQWLALARLGATTVSVSARGCELSEINLVSRIDMAAHVEHARAHERQRIDKLLTPQGRLRFEQRRQISPEERLRRIGVHRLVTDLTRAIMRRPDAPDLGPLFTGRVAAAWGGADRYQRMLWLHTMLRPSTVWGRAAHPRCSKTTRR